MSRILVVEDDSDVAKVVTYHLRLAGHSTELIESGDEVLPRVRADPPDVLILDLMLPGMDGLEICRSIRADAATWHLFIIILTARAEESDRVAGLELGADDYVSKPFSPKELVARVGAVERRAQRVDRGKPSLHYGACVLDADRHAVVIDEDTVNLTPKEFELLRFLVERRGHVVSRRLLLSDVWGYSHSSSTRTVDVHIRRLREKLPLLRGAIVTIQQRGYQLAESPP